MSGAPGDMRALLRACRRGDDRAARSLYAQVAPALRAFARSILRDGAGADDAVQGAFLAMMRTPVRRVAAVQDPAAWLAQLVRREALMMLRAAGRARRRETAVAARAGGGSAGSEEAAPGDVWRALDRLPRALREVVALRHVAGLTFDQIELATGVNRNTAAARHRRAMDELRRVMGHDDDDAGPAVAGPSTRSTSHA